MYICKILILMEFLKLCFKCGLTAVLISHFPWFPPVEIRPNLMCQSHVQSQTK